MGEIKLVTPGSVVTVTYSKRIAKVEDIRVDNFVFRLHYTFSMVLIIIFAVFYTITDWTNPTVCAFNTGCDAGPHWEEEEVIWREKLELESEICDEPEFVVPEALLGDYCWTVREGMYTYPEMIQNKSGLTSLYPGVGEAGESGYARKEHFYYQWLPAFLIFQWIMFRLPRKVWRHNEGGKMKDLCGNVVKFLLDSKDKIQFKKILSDYLVEHLKTRSTGFYAHFYCLCEILNLLCVIIQLFIFDYFTNFELSKLGISAISVILLPPKHRVDAVASLFPVLVKCDFRDFGQGDYQLRDGMCILPMNVFSENYFFLMWYYLLILAVIDCIQVLFRLITISSWRLRCTLLSNAAPFSSPKYIRTIVKNCDFSEWFVLYQLSQNVAMPIYHDVIDEYASRMLIREH